MTRAIDTGSELFLSGYASDDNGSAYQSITLDTSSRNGAWTDNSVYTAGNFATRANGILHLSSRTYSYGTVWADNGNWRARFKQDRVAGWSDSDNWHYASDTGGQETTAYAAALDSALGFLVAGMAEDNTHVRHAIIRHRDSVTP